MTIKTSTLRPGLLVSMKSSVSGNVKYTRRDLVNEHVAKDGTAQAKWETERTIIDPAEHEAAIKCRTKARLAVTRVCAASAFGLLCPESAAEELEKGIAEARQITDEFNAEAQLTRVSLYVITGRIASDDVEAMRAINSEVRDLLQDMKTGIEGCDVKTIREAASKAKSLGAMLSPDANARVQIAIEAARGAAKKLVQAGEQAAKEIDNRAIRAITESRTAFLDMDDVKDIAAPAASGRAIDMAPTARQDSGSTKPKARKVEV